MLDPGSCSVRAGSCSVRARQRLLEKLPWSLDKPLPVTNRATELPLSLFHDTVEIIVRHD